MRKDMHKVYTEPGREGGQWSYCKRSTKLNSVQLDEQPTREPMHDDWARDQVNAYSPLRRFLKANAGRPWDAVYAEIAVNYDLRSYNQRELRLQVEQMVETNVRIIDGKPVDAEGRPLRSSFWSPVYVDPSNGILTRCPESNYKRGKRHDRRKFQERGEIDKLHKLVKINKLWFVITFAEMPDPLPHIDPSEPYQQLPMDILLKQLVIKKNHNAIAYEWGAPIYAVEKKSASKKEIRDYAPKPEEEATPSA